MAKGRNPKPEGGSFSGSARSSGLSHSREPASWRPTGSDFGLLSDFGLRPSDFPHAHSTENSEELLMDENGPLFVLSLWVHDRNVFWLGGPLGSAARLGLPGCLRCLHGPGPNQHDSGVAPGTDETGTR